MAAPRPSAPPPPGARTVRLPDPDAAAIALVWSIVLAMLGFVPSTWAVFQLYEHLPVVGVVAVFLLPVALPVFVHFHGPLFPKPVVARRSEASVFGLPGGPLPARVGQLVVERFKRRSGRGHTFVYRVRYEGPMVTRDLFDRGRNPTTVRTCVEGLCRVGSWPMIWRSPEGDEVRRVEELDLPLVARLSAGRGHDDGTAKGPERPLRLSRTATGEVRLRGRRHHPLTWAGIFATLLAMAAIAAVLEPPDSGFSLRWLLGVEGVAFAVGLALLLGDLAVSREVEVSAAGVRLRRSVLGLFGSQTFVPAARIESLYVEERGLYHRVVVAGDGFHHLAGSFDSMEQAVDARRRIVGGLLGR